MDIRFAYWMLDEVAGAKHLIEELGVAAYQGPPPAAEQPESDGKANANPSASKTADGAKGDVAGARGAASGACVCNLDEPGRVGGSLGLLALGLLGLGLRSRRAR